jgi:alpha-tubulin suppressor-like RCC1 family protein
MAVQQYLMMGRAASGRKIITGERWVFGNNAYGIGGVGNDTGLSLPLQVGALENWQNTEQPGGHVANCCTVKSDGTLWTWGRNNNGTLGLGDTTTRSSPVQVGSDTDWLDVCHFSGFMGAIKTDGTFWTWGGGSAGQLGHGNTTNYSSPVQVGSATDWAHVIAWDANASIVMKTNGALYYSGTGSGFGASNVSTHIQVGSETGFVDCIGKAEHLIMWKEA